MYNLAQFEKDFYNHYEPKTIEEVPVYEVRDIGLYTCDPDLLDQIETKIQKIEMFENDVFESMLDDILKDYMQDLYQSPELARGA